jgi:hypothetical protein
MTEIKNEPCFNVKDIAGYTMLQERFGGWPDFHDAEIMLFSVERFAEITGVGPVISLVVHISNIQYAEDDPRRNYSYVTLKFYDVDRLKLEEFNYQNAINYLDLSQIAVPQPQGRRITVELGGGFGINCSFRCARIEVSSVVPAAPARQTLA